MDIHHYCRGQLKLARFEAKAECIKLPFIKSSFMSPDHYAVFAEGVSGLLIGDFDYREYHACCAFNARAQYIHDFIDFMKGADNV